MKEEMKEMKEEMKKKQRCKEVTINQIDGY
jgi:hypothetical protein